MGSQMTAWQVQKQFSRLWDVFYAERLIFGELQLCPQQLHWEQCQKEAMTEDCHQQRHPLYAKPVICALNIKKTTVHKAVCSLMHQKYPNQSLPIK